MVFGDPSFYKPSFVVLRVPAKLFKIHFARIFGHAIQYLVPTALSHRSCVEHNQYLFKSVNLITGHRVMGFEGFKIDITVATSLSG